MSTVYTHKQLRFLYIFDLHIKTLLKSFLNIEEEPKQNNLIDGLLDHSSTGINTLSATVAVAGLASAPPTMGTSIAGASACIVLLQTLSCGYQFIKRHIDNNEPFSPDETQLDDIHLSLTILMRQVGYLACVRYRHFIDEIIEEHSVSTFATFLADRAMKKLEVDLSHQSKLSENITPEAFLDYFMTSTRLSFINDATKVSIKEEYSKTNQCSSTAIYAKLACSLPGLAVYNNSTPGDYTLMVSPPRHFFSTDKTTLQDYYGFATVPNSELNSTTAAVNRKKLQPLSSAKQSEELNKSMSHFSVHYFVSRQEVIDYLAEIKAVNPPEQPIKTLNQYLSERHKTNLIAACKDNRLQNLDLSYGNFSEVWFVGQVNLSHCDLSHTQWNKAHVNGAIFEKNKLSHINFQSVYAEKTTWIDISFTGDFSHTKFNGSKLKKCMITNTFNHLDCEWNLSELDITNEDAIAILNQRINEQFNRGQNEIIQINREMSNLSEQLGQYIQHSHQCPEIPASEKQNITHLKQKMDELENQYNHYVEKNNVQLSDIKSLLSHIEQNQQDAQHKQDETIKILSTRVNTLEQNKKNNPPLYYPGPLFFQANQNRFIRQTPSKEQTNQADESKEMLELS